MPIRKMSEGAVFDPSQVRELTSVYQEVIAALGMVALTDLEKAAKTVLRIASEQQDFDASKVQAQAIAELKP